VLDALVSIKAIPPPAPAPGKFFDNHYVADANGQLNRGR
jgi:hypothetical protein